MCVSVCRLDNYTRLKSIYSDEKVLLFIFDILENVGELHVPPYRGERLEADGACLLEAAQQLLAV